MEESIGRCIPFCRCSQVQVNTFGIDGEIFFDVDSFGIPFRDFRNADGRVFGKCVAAIGSDIIFILTILFAIACQRRDESSLSQQLATGTFAVFIKRNVSRFQCMARCGKAFCDFHIAGEILLTACRRAIGQLSCQSVQNTQNVLLIVHRHIVVPSDEGNLRTHSRLANDGVTCCVVISCFAISFMCIVDIRRAAVIINGQVIFIFLEDVACVSCIAAANEFCQVASVVRFRPPCVLFYFAPFFIVPGSSVLQEYVDRAVECLAACLFTCITELVVCHTSPFGVCRCQSQIDVSVLFRFVGVHGTR